MEQCASIERGIERIEQRGESTVTGRTLNTLNVQLTVTTRV